MITMVQKTKAKKTVKATAKTKQATAVKAAKKILVVDDEEPICTLVKELLQGAGYSVRIALNGNEALAKLRAEKVDLALVDFFMPGMSGRELCEAIREDPQLKNTNLAFLTVAQFGKGGYEEIKELGLKDYIKKPFDNQDLIARVGKIVEGRKPKTLAGKKKASK